MAPSLWLRFLDDILILWTGGDVQLQNFLQHLNSQMTSIKFTMTSSLEATTFLDLEIYKGHRFRRCGVLDTRLHVKATNPQTFLHFTSCHPPSTFRTIIKGELLRALRCTSDVDTYTQTVAKLFSRFLERGYPRHLFMEVADSIHFGQRSDLLLPSARKELAPNVTIFTTSHHPALDSAAIRRLLMDQETPFEPMVVRPRPTSHRDMLVRAKTPGRNNNNITTTKDVDVEDRGDQPSTAAHHHQRGSTQQQ